VLAGVNSLLTDESVEMREQSLIANLAPDASRDQQQHALGRRRHHGHRIPEMADVWIAGCVNRRGGREIEADLAPDVEIDRRRDWGGRHARH
jgi:hypothetical protein